LMISGEIKRHIRRTFKIYNERRNVLMNLVNSQLSDFVNFDEPSGGLAFWLRLNHGININEIEKNALNKNVRILPGTLFSASSQEVHAIRLGFGSLDVKELTLGIRKLRDAFCEKG